MKYDVIIAGGDSADVKIAMAALQAGKSCCLVAEGRLSGEGGRNAFAKAGGVLLLGDRISSVEWAEDGSVAAVHTANLEDERLVASVYVLAAGRFFTRGLVSDMQGISEPVFGTDVQFEPDRSKWCVEDFFAPQPFESFGVITDEDRHPLKNGKAIVNLYAAGEILAGGVDNIEEICRRIISA